jgi:hypothetical protein
MALLQLRPPVNYEEQQGKLKNSINLVEHEAEGVVAAFEDFLKAFKSTTVETEDALNDLHINEDEYDFMDDSDDNAAIRQPRTRNQQPKAKYMNVLQDVANRVKSQILIDLDDLDNVRTHF